MAPQLLSRAVLESHQFTRGAAGVYHRTVPASS